MPDPSTKPPWPTAAVLRTIVLVFTVFIALRFLWLVRSVVIIAFVAVLFGLVMTPAVDWLERHRVRRGIGAPLVVLAFLGLLTGFGALIAPTVRDQSRDLQKNLPQAIDTIESWLARPEVAALMPAAGQTPPESPAQPAVQPPVKKPGPEDPATAGGGEEAGGASRLRELVSRQLGGIVGVLFPFVSSAVGAAAGVLIVLVIAIYIAADPRLYRLGLLHLVPHSRRDRAKEVMTETGDALRQWMVARLLAMLAVGIITTVALMLLGVRSAVALGIIAGLLEFIPFFGPVIAAIPAIGVALVESPQKALFVAFAFTIIQQLEGNVISPLLLKRRIDVPPALTVLTVSAMGIVFGFLGLLVAEPLLVAVLVLIKMLYVNDVVGDEVASIGR
ncbi:MAG: AI-2E family transporter [Thermoanaerobaculia bacterium]